MKKIKHKSVSFVGLTFDQTFFFISRSSIRCCISSRFCYHGNATTCAYVFIYMRGRLAAEAIPQAATASADLDRDCDRPDGAGSSEGDTSALST